jgi:hypothetical protein
VSYFAAAAAAHQTAPAHGKEHFRTVFMGGIGFGSDQVVVEFYSSYVHDRYKDGEKRSTLSNLQPAEPC